MPVAIQPPVVPSQAVIAAEVYHASHRWQGTYARPQNGLLRYSINRLTPGHPLVEAWTGTAWASCGTYLLQAYNGAVYTQLPLQSFLFRTVSPEEIVWEEQRYDNAGTALVRLVNRIRRGSRLIESQIIAYSGQGLTGVASITMYGTGATGSQGSGDNTSIIATGTTAVPGFCYLDGFTSTPFVGSGNLYSGLSIAAGTQKRISVLAGVQDAMFTTLGTGAYAQRWGQYNRQRVKQRIILS